MGELFVLNGKAITVDLDEVRKRGVINVVMLNVVPSFISISISHSKEKVVKFMPKIKCCYKDKEEHGAPTDCRGKCNKNLNVYQLCDSEECFLSSFLQCNPMSSLSPVSMVTFSLC